MFRLKESHGPTRTVIRIDGRLAGDYVRLAEEHCLRALEAGRRVEVFLRELTALDAAGRDLLLGLARRGVRLRAWGPYFSHLLKLIRRAGAAAGHSLSDGR